MAEKTTAAVLREWRHLPGGNSSPMSSWRKQTMIS